MFQIQPSFNRDVKESFDISVECDEKQTTIKLMNSFSFHLRGLTFL